MDMDQELLAELDDYFGYAKPAPSSRPERPPTRRPVVKRKIYKSGSKLDRRTGMRIVYEPDHPLANTRGPYKGWVLEHRKLCWDAGLMTDPTQQVMHLNKILNDNRMENLEVRGTAARCAKCGNVNRTDGELCGACQVKLERRAKFRLTEEPVRIDDDLKKEIKNLCFGVVASYLQPYFRRSIGGLVQKREKAARDAAFKEMLLFVDDSKDLEELRGKVANMMTKREEVKEVI
jgi:hypothetical protein